MAKAHATIEQSTPQTLQPRVLISAPPELASLPFEERTVELRTLESDYSRLHLLPDQTHELMEDIKAHGLRVPISVMEMNPDSEHPDRKYRVIDGERRWAAMFLSQTPAGGLEIPIRIYSLPKGMARMIQIRRAAQAQIYAGLSIEVDESDNLLYQLAVQLQKPEALPLPVDLLDRIADGAHPDAFEGADWENLAMAAWHEGILPAVNWWKDVALEILGSKGSADRMVNPALAGQREAIASLIHSVLEAYAPVLKEGVYFREPDGEILSAGVELLKRYRAFTRYVCNFAQELRPGVNLQRLFERS